jgi:hypothetical protein
LCICLGNSSPLHRFKHQILNLSIDFADNIAPIAGRILPNIFSSVLKMFKNLSYLNFEPSQVYWKHIPFDTLRPQRISSLNLFELHINLKNFHSCVYLLDGRFNELQAIFINIAAIETGQTIDNQVNSIFH